MHKQEKRLMSGIQRPLMCASRLRPIQYTQCYAVKGQKAGDSFDDSETDDMDCSMTSSTERRTAEPIQCCRKKHYLGTKNYR